MESFVEVSLILGIATVVAWIMQILRQPLILGHVITGILAGPVLLGIIKSQHELELFSKIGIAALLFIVGLSLHPKVAREVGKISVYAGVGQVVFTAVSGFFIARGFGFDALSSIYIAVALTFSSTIIIMKLLSDKRDLGKLYGKISIGILLVQDLIATVVLILLSTLGRGGNAGGEIGVTLLKGVLVGAVLWFVAKYVLPSLTRAFAASQEFLFLFAVAWGLGIASLFQALGFSVEIGALAAGLTLASSPYQYEISAKMKLIRDFFIVIFFILLGAQLTFLDFDRLWVPTLVLSLFVLVGNPLILLAIMGMMGYSKRTSFLTGLTVAQISEFSLVMVILGLELGHVGRDVVSLVTFVGLITISISSYMIMGADKLFDALKPMLGLFERKRPKSDRERRKSYQILLIGCHRLGRDFLPYLLDSGKTFLVVDFDPMVIDELTRRDISCRYGDAEDNEFFDELDLSKTEMLISTLPDPEANEFVVQKIRSVNKKAVVIVTGHTVEQALFLYDAGASYVILPHFLGGNYASLLVGKYGTDIRRFDQERGKHIRHLRARRDLLPEHARAGV